MTWFDESGVRAGKLDAQPLEPGSDRLTCGPAAQGPGGSRGAIGLDGLSAEWDLAFAARGKPLEHVRPAFLYGAALPKTKATSPAPDVDVSGSLVVDGSTVDLAGWTGMVGHNWGSQHAARWVWLRVCGLGDDGAGWLDAVLGRVQVGPVLAPWKAFGALSLDGTRHHLGGLPAAARTSRCAPTVRGSPWPGPTRRSPSRRPCRSPSTVGWEYADPSGDRHEVVNCSVASMELEADLGGRVTTYAPTRRGVLELGADERSLDVPLQPFPDSAWPLDTRMTRTTSSFSGVGGITIEYDVYEPEGEPKGLLLIAHGLGEHRGRYEHVAHGSPRSGSGWPSPTTAATGSPADRAPTPGTSTTTPPTSSPAQAHPGRGLPTYLLGHSMGGLVAFDYALDHQADLKALMLSGALVLPGDDQPPWLVAIAKVLGKVVPTLGTLALDPKSVSKDPKVVAAYEADPLNNHSKIKAGTGAALLNRLQTFPDRLPSLTLPLLVMHGEQDKLTNPEGSKLVDKLAARPTRR